MTERDGRRLRSIRFRLILGSIVATTIAVALAGVAIDGIITTRLRAEHIRSLESLLELGARRAVDESLAKTSGMGRRAALFPEAETESLTGSPTLWLVRSVRSGDVVASAQSFPRQQIQRTQPSDDPQVIEVENEQAERYRIAAVRLSPRDIRPPRPRRPLRRGDGERRDDDGPRRGRDADVRRRGPGSRPEGPFDVFVAVSIDEEVQTIRLLRGAIALGGICAIGGSALLLWWVIASSLRPLTALAQRVKGIDADRLEEPIELHDAPTELVPIVSALEETRTRLADAFDRERRFSADAAHELRTPLAGLRAALEVALRRERTLAMHEKTATECLAMTISMQEVVDSLLSLARLNLQDEERGPVELFSTFRAAFGQLDQNWSERGISIAERGSEIGSVIAFQSLVDRIAANLASNAASYALDGSTIELVGERAHGATRIAVTNACTPQPMDIDKLAFEPFWRSDTVRGHTRLEEHHHAGLGLSLARRAAEAMGGTLTVQYREGALEGQFMVVLALPTAPV